MSETFAWADRRHRAARPANGQPWPAAPDLAPTGDLELYSAYLEAALDAEEERVASAPVGSRNECLNVAAFNLGQLCPAYLPEDGLRHALVGWGRAAGLELAETIKTVSSGLTAGMAEPRTIVLREPDVEIIDGAPQQPAEILTAHQRAVRKELGRLRAQAEARQLWALERMPARPALRVASLADVLAAPAEPPARISELIGWQASTLIVAQRKTGKTTLLINLVLALLTGQDFLGRFKVRPVQGRIALINYEVSAAQIGRWCAEVGIPADRLILVNLRGGANPLATAEGRAELARELRALGVEAVLIDPFSRAYTGASQNDSGEVMAWLMMLEGWVREEIGALDLIMAAHAGWNGERSRGASALEDWPDVILTMNREEQGQGRRYLRAIGRDVELEEDELIYAGRLLSLSGAGSRSGAAQLRRDLELESAVLAALGDHDGIGVRELLGTLRERGVQVRNGDQSRAANRLIEKGLVIEEIGPRRTRLLHRRVLT